MKPPSQSGGSREGTDRQGGSPYIAGDTVTYLKSSTVATILAVHQDDAEATPRTYTHSTPRWHPQAYYTIKHAGGSEVKTTADHLAPGGAGSPHKKPRDDSFPARRSTCDLMQRVVARLRLPQVTGMVAAVIYHRAVDYFGTQSQVEGTPQGNLARVEADDLATACVYLAGKATEQKHQRSHIHQAMLKEPRTT